MGGTDRQPHKGKLQFYTIDGKTYKVGYVEKALVVGDTKSKNPLAVDVSIKKQRPSYLGHSMQRENSFGNICWEWVAVQEREADHEHAGQMTSRL